MDYKKIFQSVFDELGFSATKVFREGPRFYVAGGQYKGEKAIFKADVEEGDPQNRRAYFKLRREAAFLECGNLAHIPKFFAKGERGDYFWLLEEWVPGESQEVGASTFLLKDSFFTEQNLVFCLEFLEVLNKLPKTNQNPKFEGFKEKFAKRYTLKDYTSLIASDRHKLVGGELMDIIYSYLERRHKIFDTNQVVIAHHEFYAPHIFVNGGELNVIDWENVGWGNPAYDFSELWFRSVTHADFQRELFERFRSRREDRDTWDELFNIEVLLQGLGNLKHFKVSSVPEDKEMVPKIKDFILNNINKVLNE
ncbi:phosphotransferase [Candidatus Saccharibacteria bacterium]|nr:phosphotransferase [Candidatus Saccharibacteria bacterium]